jgi:hypothetical protein
MCLIFCSLLNFVYFIPAYNFLILIPIFSLCFILLILDVLVISSSQGFLFYSLSDFLVTFFHLFNINLLNCFFQDPQLHIQSLSFFQNFSHYSDFYNFTIEWPAGFSFFISNVYFIFLS